MPSPFRVAPFRPLRLIKGERFVFPGIRIASDEGTLCGASVFVHVPNTLKLIRQELCINRPASSSTFPGVLLPGRQVLACRDVDLGLNPGDSEGIALSVEVDVLPEAEPGPCEVRYEITYPVNLWGACRVSILTDLEARMPS